MSWPLWNQTAMPTDVSGYNGLSGYTPEQWTAMQQQNWQQWSLWQHQYAQWQMQYGDKYTEQMKNEGALSAMGAMGALGAQPPLPPAIIKQAPPPPPDAPPPPASPCKPPQPQAYAQGSSFNLASNAKSQYYNQMPNTTKQPPQNQNYENFNRDDGSNLSKSSKSNANTINRQWQNDVSSGNDNRYSRNSYGQNSDQWNGPHQGNSSGHQRDDNSLQNKSSNVSSASVLNMASTNSQGTDITNQLTEEEKQFDLQFKKWENDFVKWKEENLNHPDKAAYNDYEKKFEACRAQLLERKEQMRLKRITATVSSTAASTEKFNNSSDSNQTNRGTYNYGQDDRVDNSYNDSNYRVQYGNGALNDQSSFISSSNAKGIPGLDLVVEDTSKKPIDVIDLDEIDKGSKGPDFSALSVGINNILGDQKLLQLLSMVANAGNVKNQSLAHNSADNINPRSESRWNNDDGRITNINKAPESFMNSFQNQSVLNITAPNPVIPSLMRNTNIAGSTTRNQSLSASHMNVPTTMHQHPNMHRSNMNRPSLLSQPMGLMGHNNNYGIQMTGNRNMGMIPQMDHSVPPPAINRMSQGSVPNWNPNIPNQAMSNQGMPNQRLANQGVNIQGSANQSVLNQSVYNQGVIGQGISNVFSNQGRSQTFNSMSFDPSNLSQKPLMEQNVDPLRGEGITGALKNSSGSPRQAPIESLSKPSWLNVPILEPATVVDYQHKPIKRKDIEFLEPVQTFDYGHKSSNKHLINEPKEDRAWLDFERKKSGLSKAIDYQNKLINKFSENSSWGDRNSEFDSPTGSRYDDRGRDIDDNFRRGEKYSDRDFNRRESRRFDRRDDRWDDRRYDRRDDRREDRKDERMGSRYDDRSRERSREKRSRFERPQEFHSDRFSESNTSSPSLKEAVNPSDREMVESSNVVMIDDILEQPGRDARPQKLVIIIRGLPGSGKSYIAKIIKDREVENGGSAPRILSIDDYFISESEGNEKSGRKENNPREMKYEYDKSMEETYIASLIKAFRRTVSDGYFSFIIVDSINNYISHYREIIKFAKQNGFKPYICQMDMDVQCSFKRNIHGRTLEDIQALSAKWFRNTPHHTLLDITTLLQTAGIDHVQMEDVSDHEESDVAPGGAAEPANVEEDEVLAPFSSKWDRMDDTDKLARLDGTSKPLRHTAGTMEDFLQLDDWTATKKIPGKKSVRWADIEEKRQQEKMRAIGFVVGQTDWDRMTDPTQGSSALTQTKYIERIKKF